MFTLKNFTISYNNNDVIDTEEKKQSFVESCRIENISKIVMYSIDSEERQEECVPLYTVVYDGNLDSSYVSLYVDYIGYGGVSAEWLTFNINGSFKDTLQEIMNYINNTYCKEADEYFISEEWWDCDLCDYFNLFNFTYQDLSEMMNIIFESDLGFKVDEDSRLIIEVKKDTHPNKVCFIDLDEFCVKRTLKVIRENQIIDKN